MKHLRMLVMGIILLASSWSAQAGHENVPFLSDAIPVRGGMCSVNGEFTVPCEQYIKPDGSLYLAMYLNGEIAVVRKLNPDGSVGAVVWSQGPAPSPSPKPAAAGREA